MEIEVRASVLIAATPEGVFDTITQPDAPAKTFDGYGPIPGCTHSEIVSEGGMKVGAIRRIHNTDGSVIDEEILALDSPRQHAYRLLSGLKPPFTWLVREARGRWTLEPHDQATHVEWVFSFAPRNRLAATIIRLVLTRPFQLAMQKGLENTRRSLED
jgi:uncharacterized protein YndB with AHSA1/START domain